MNVFVFAGILGISMVVTTLIISSVMLGLSKAIVNNNATIEASKSRYKTNVTKGHKIAVEADRTDQLKEAKQVAAQQAAALPRGANMRIGRLGEENLQTASQNLTNDPITTVKIAQQQGWTGLGEFNRMREAAAGAGATTAVAKAGPQVKRKLVAGKDYPVTEITADMEPAEKRRVRIANAKAKSAAYKALKESGQDMVAAAPVASAPAAASSAPTAEQAAAAAGIEPPELIEITDDMAPADVRKARIANAKANSAYKKALKAAGIDSSAPSEASAPAPAASAPAPAPEPTPAATAVPNDIPRPDLIEITDDMNPNDVRKARIANAKAASAYKKALKAAGIDPSTVEI